MNKPLLDIPQPPHNSRLLPTQDYNPIYVDEPSQEQINKQNLLKNKASGQLFRIIVLSTLFFIILSHPILYKITHKAVQYIVTTPFNIINQDQCPTLKGIFVHAGLFFIIMLFVVYY